SRRRHTRSDRDWSSDVCSSDLANAAAKAAGATPFKRPENGVFRPGSRFSEFYFTETGDTNALTEAGSAGGGFGGIFRLTQLTPRSEERRVGKEWRPCRTA